MNKTHFSDLNVLVGGVCSEISTTLLDTSAQKHKLAVKPKKRHASTTQKHAKKLCPQPGERYGGHTQMTLNK
jgi:hypothetical protein